ncbi:MAG TPA: glycerol kinase GlpK [Acidimicrobiia bacterium]|nr:glycerol kinase GlpK [Acidimicrobiia bacterium]
MTRLVGAIDQGTTSSRFMIFDDSGRVVSQGQEEHRQIFPRPGWVEHDPIEIMESIWRVIGRALDGAGLSAKDLAAVGITNQRETTVAWDRRSGMPLHNAIVWQDTRTAELCRNFEGGAGPDRFRSITGLPLATYFSGPKLAWLIREVPAVADAAGSENLAFGTMDAWILSNLVGRAVTDVTNASRTLLMDLRTGAWSGEICETMGIPMSSLPEIVSSSERVGLGTGPLEGVPVSGVLGDQQAALFGQLGFGLGTAKNTYGTGCFMLQNTGESPINSRHGLLTTAAFRLMGQPIAYALEGSVAVAGSLIQWLRDNLGLIESSNEIEALAASVPDNGDVFFVPAFSGLFAPYWRPDARGTIVGLTRFANRGHIARAALEATAFQTTEVAEAMEADSGVDLTELRVDGGMVRNNLLMQFQADLLGVPVVRPQNSETTALGAAYAAGLAEGVWQSLSELDSNWAVDRRFEPEMNEDRREELMARWKQAVTRTLDWA